MGLVIFLIVHFAFPQDKEVFSSAMINRRIDYDRDKELEKDFANDSGLDVDLVDIDSHILDMR